MSRLSDEWYCMNCIHQEECLKCRTQANLRVCKALEAEIDREIERVNSIIPPPKQPEQKNLFTD